jgi:hypothetical protein
MKENSDEHTYIHEQVHTIFYIFVKPVPHVVVVIVVFPPLYIHFSSRVRYFLRPRFTFTNIHDIHVRDAHQEHISQKYLDCTPYFYFY